MAFTHYTPFTVASSQITGTLTGETWLLLPTDNRFRTIANGGSVANANGYDIRPYASDGVTALTYELASYNAVTGAIEMYVLVPSIADATEIRLYYGDAALSSDGSSNTVWPSPYLAVWHLNSTAESTATGYTLTSSQVGGAGAVSYEAGKIGNGARITHTSNSVYNYLSRANADAFNLTALQWECWVKNTIGGAGGANTYNGILCYSNAAGTTYFELFHRNSAASQKLRIDAKATTGISYDANGSFGGLVNNTWHHLSMEYDSTNGLTVYADNALDKNVAANGNLAQATGRLFAIGGDENGGVRTFEGVIDEVRVRSAARSTANRNANYKNQSAPNTFWSMGAEVAVGGGGSGGAAFAGSIFNSSIFNSPIFNSRIFG